MTFDVFISYPHQDKTAADAACAALEAAGIRCWIAPRDVEPGAEWAASIMEAIEQCRVMVLIFSGNANESKQVRREVQNAFDRDVPVIPLRLENVAPGKSLSFYMNSVHWLDALTPPLEQHLARLTQRVTALLRTASSRLDTQHGAPPPNFEQGATDQREATARAERTRREAADAAITDTVVERLIQSLHEQAATKSAAECSHDFFIACALEDKIPAEALCAGLEKKGMRCWIGTRDIQPSVGYQAAIVPAILGSRAAALVFSANTHNSEHVLRELELAAHAKIPIYPLRIDNAAPKGGFAFLLANHQFPG